MAAQLHVMNAGQALGVWADRAVTAFPAAIGQINSHLAVDDLDIVLYASNGFMIIPELGMGGFSEHGHFIRLMLDPTNPHIEDGFRHAFEGLLTHECHHCMRERGPGYGKTLADSLIAEGLACQFEREVTGRLPFYALPLSDEEVRNWRARIDGDLQSDYQPGWMFGDKSRGIERHFGYRLGSALVAEWLRSRGLTAAKAVHQPTAQFFPV